jgi:hypothetical protein
LLFRVIWVKLKRPLNKCGSIVVKLLPCSWQISNFLSPLNWRLSMEESWLSFK